MNMFVLKQILLHSKIPLSILGMIIPFVFVSIVYQLRYKMKPFTYKLGIMASTSLIALVPAIIVILQYTPSLDVGDCVESRKRSTEIELDSGKKITVPLIYKVLASTDGKYEVIGNDKSVLKMKINRIDLNSAYKLRSNCPGIK